MKNTTDILKFYEADKPLFVMSGLAGEDIERFVDREKQLEYIIASIRLGQNCAVTGEQGAGKSSFLLKLMAIMQQTRYCDYLQFSFPAEESGKSRLHFLRKVLRTLLALIAGNEPLLKRFEPGEIEFQVELLEYSIIIEDHLKTQKVTDAGLEGGLKSEILSFLIPAEFKVKLNLRREQEKGKIEKKDYPIHNENTLFDTIIKLSAKIDEPIVLFIDELDKVGRYPLSSPEWDKEVIRILELSRDIMLSDKLILVFALQIELYEKLRKAERDEGDISILGLINAFKKLDGFDLEFALNAVDASLKYAGYKKSSRDLFENGVLEIVLEVVKGNPRLFMYYLLELVKTGFLEKQRRITLEMLKNVLKSKDEKLDDKRWNEMASKYIAATHSDR
ncbi:MAG: AAA family ATPase [Candidatus Aminicenantes bacterium]|nr:AAA family ATPase [Candidatus Aminicenantes bacterium]